MTRKTGIIAIIATVTGIVVGAGATLGATFAITEAATPEPEPNTVVQYEVVEVKVTTDVCRQAAEQAEALLVDQIHMSAEFRDATTQAELAEIDTRFEGNMLTYGDTIAPLVDACRGPNT